MQLKFVTGIVFFFFSSFILSAQFTDYPAETDVDILKDKKVLFTGVPIINYNNSFGMGFGALPMAVYKFNQDDTISPPSSSMLLGFGTTNKTWGVGAFNLWYVHQDKYRFIIGYLYASVNFQTYTDVFPPGGIFIGFNTDGHYLFVEGQRETFKHLYLGLGFLYTQVQTEFDFDIINKPIETKLSTYNALSTVISYDNRDNKFTPGEGFYTTLRPFIYRTWIGSRKDFENYNYDFNYYHSFKRNLHHMLASRLNANISFGDVPFESQNILGGDDIRGYTDGKFRDEQVYTMQAEWRWNFYKRFGMVAFMGIGFVTDNIKELAKNGTLPGGGVGFRYLAIKSERITLGIDGAVGKDDWGIYFRIGEAF